MRISVITRDNMAFTTQQIILAYHDTRTSAPAAGLEYARVAVRRDLDWVVRPAGPAAASAVRN